MRGEAEIGAVFRDLAAAVFRGIGEQGQEMRRAGLAVRCAGEIRQPADDAGRALEGCDVARIGRIAGIGQIAPGDFVVILPRLVDGIGEILVRHDIRGAQDHQVFRTGAAENRVDGLLVLLGILAAGDCLALEPLHRSGIVEEDQPALDAARGIRLHEIGDRRLDPDEA